MKTTKPVLNLVNFLKASKGRRSVSAKFDPKKTSQWSWKKVGQAYRPFPSQHESSFLSANTILDSVFNKTSNINDYSGNLLGEGSGGKVFLGIDTVRGSKVAMKLIEKNKFRVEEALFPYLVHNMSNNPNAKDCVTQIIDVCEPNDSDNKVFIIANHCPFGDLFGKLESEQDLPINLTGRLQTFQHMINAVETCHNQGVLHLDIKLENFMVTSETSSPRPEVQLIDFGAATTVGTTHTSTQTIRHAAGTRQYSPPELQKQRQESYCTVSRATDIYSLGICLFAMTTNLLPYNGSDRNPKVSYQLPATTKQVLRKETIHLMDAMCDDQPSNRPTLEEVTSSLQSQARAWDGKDFILHNK